MDGELNLAAGFPMPPNVDYKGYHTYIDEALPSESPILYGLHPNAEIEFLSQISEVLFRTVFELQPRDSGAGTSGGVSREEKVCFVLLEFFTRLPTLQTQMVQGLENWLEYRLILSGAGKLAEISINFERGWNIG